MPDHLRLFVVALVAFVATTSGIAAYTRIARRLDIVAIPSERTLHVGRIVRGGGVVIAIVFLVGTAWLFATGRLPQAWFFALFVGGVAVSALGFIDDIVNLSTRTRLVAHIGLAIWGAAWIGEPFGLGVFGYAIVVFGLVWMINLYNFMDGIDGMAASGATFFCVGAFVLLGASSSLTPLLAILGAASIGFLLFNWPPARLFMGDSGSGFYGYIFGVLALISIRSSELPLTTWMILLGYFIGDTTTTTAIRAVTVPRFWETHRSHAYQNLARIWDNHRRMTVLVLVVQLAWLFPLAALSVAVPGLAIPLVAIALAPIVVFTIRYGPLYA